MRSIGAPELLLVYLVFLAIPVWVVWKFYRALRRVSDELAGIREILSRRPPPNPV